MKRTNTAAAAAIATTDFLKYSCRNKTAQGRFPSIQQGKAVRGFVVGDSQEYCTNSGMLICAGIQIEENQKIFLKKAILFGLLKRVIVERQKRKGQKAEKHMAFRPPRQPYQMTFPACLSLWRESSYNSTHFPKPNIKKNRKTKNQKLHFGITSFVMRNVSEAAAGSCQKKGEDIFSITPERGTGIFYTTLRLKVDKQICEDVLRHARMTTTAGWRPPRRKTKQGVK